MNRRITYVSKDRIEKLEDAVRDVLNVLGEPCPNDTCEGCAVEMREARSILEEVMK